MIVLFCIKKHGDRTILVVMGEINETEESVIKYSLSAAVSDIRDSYETGKDSRPQRSQRLLLLILLYCQEAVLLNYDVQEIPIVSLCIST